ncbi:MAG: Mov34/MPN/PAD-1 family protein [Promethearchaeati archaeon SRVP18_Atabeyarchaeia-1]
MERPRPTHPVKLKKEVLDGIRKQAQSASNEIAGLLLGRMRGNTLIVTDIVTGEQSGSRTHVVLDDEFLARVASEYGEQGKKKSIVGWYHSHPDLGCFVSSTDFETQRRFQALFSDAIGLVIDPSPPERLAVFRVGEEKPKSVKEEAAAN